MAGSARTSRVRLIAVLALLAVLVLLIYLRSASNDSPIETLLAWGWQTRYEALPMEDEGELAEYHLAANEGVREQCVACHGDKTESELLVHGIHLRSDQLPDLDCRDCHPRVDIGPREDASTDRWVDVAFCKSCHSAFPGLDAASDMDPHDIEADCTMCHTGDRAPKHDQPFLLREIDPSDCKGCHGGRVLPWTPAHERENWLDYHGVEALESASEDCFECHDFGLKFCDECHAERPPSHLPEGRWSAIHADEAAADTRVCYSCHETSHCKKCHVDHEVGWMATHPTFVAENGQSSCTECHSESACSFCHTHGIHPE